MSGETGLAESELPAPFHVLGVPVRPLDLERTVALVDQALEARTKIVLCHANVHGVMTAQEDRELSSAFATGVTVADGMPLVWLGRLAGHPEVGRVYGPDLMLRTADLCARRGLSGLLYGGAPGVAEELGKILEERFPGLRICGAISPPFRQLSDAEEAEEIRRINAACPDVVWIGLGCPKQETWAHRNRERLDAPILASVGAAFDFHVGRVRQAPPWIQNAGLEWLFRLSREPRRLWRRYLVLNTLFVARIARRAVARALGRDNW